MIKEKISHEIFNAWLQAVSACNYIDFWAFDELANIKNEKQTFWGKRFDITNNNYDRALLQRVDD